jgi:pimeloyl-ACP methyl ester carboxylesterase
MVYEDEKGQIQDILRPENHAQVIRQMWDEPASKVLPRLRKPTLVVPAEPRPERANSEFAVMRREQVDMASRVIQDCRVQWIADTSHDIGYHQPQELARVITEFLDSLEG